ncbi:carboxypeptidase-like regulatory domain-containing protein [bacterium]|nr:carboxypeptidase-like regulatory domain-containing protein [bacterium]
MQKNIILITTILVVGIVGFVVWSGGNLKTPKSVEVEVLDGSVKVSSSPRELEKTLSKGERYSSDETLSPEIASTIQPTAEPNGAQAISSEPAATPEPTGGALAVKITDALQDEIPNGKIKINEDIYDFSQGEFRLDEPPTPPFTIAAAADGYFDATREVASEADLQSALNLELEYKVAFDLEVFQDMGMNEKAVDATVYLRKAMEAQRPPSREFSLDYNTINVDFETARVRVEGNHLLVLNAKADTWPAMDNQDGLETGDQIFALSGLTFAENKPVPADDSRRPNRSLELSDVNSRRLRILDALLFYAQGPSINSFGESIYFTRQNKTYHTSLVRFQGNENQQLVDEAQTDSSGHCRFENLRPGLYFAEAVQGKSRSHFIPLHPAMGGYKVRMSDSSHVVLHIQRKAEGRESIIDDQIEGANIMFKPASGGSGGMFGGKSERFGWKTFDQIPYGEYQLSVIPPDDSNCQPYSETFTINRPSYIRDIELDPIGGKGLVISGRVLDKEEPHNPVANYPVKLLYRSNYVEGGGGWGINDVGVVESAADGSFEFSNLKEGTYDVTSDFESDAVKTYYPASSDGSKYAPDDYGRMNNYLARRHHGYILTINLYEESAENADVYVEQSVKTTFQGTVVDPQGTPIAGAWVTLPDVENVEPEKFITDESGQFEISFYGRSSEEKVTLKIKAMLGETIPTHRKKMGEGMYTIVPETFETSAEASQTVEVKFGETVSDIRLTIEPIKQYEIHGKIHWAADVEPGTPFPEGLNVYYYNENKEISGNVTEAGDFSITIHKTGPFSIHVRDEYHQVHDAQYGAQFQYDCASTYQQNTLNEDGTYEPMDIEIQQIGIIAGIVNNAQSEPVNEVTILPKLGQETKFHAKTNSNGIFWLSMLAKGEKYDLNVILPGQSEPVTVIEQVEAPNKNMIITLPE